MRSPRSSGQLAGALAVGLSESTYGNIFGHERGGSPDSRTVTIDVQPGTTGFHKGRGSAAYSATAPDAGTKFAQLEALKALDVSWLDLGIGVLPSRRHSQPPPRQRETQNEIVQHIKIWETTGKIGRRAPSPRTRASHEEEEERCAPAVRGRTPRGQAANVYAESGGSPMMVQNASYKQIPQKLDNTSMDKKLLMKRPVNNEKTMQKSLRRLDACAAKLEKVAKDLVKEAQRQSLKCVA
eukprot:TRINITY_DN75868_c0_g1_i1.p1 TRINITY_DN75868_c0_g1~~TRINITY_DN75868_c0_g1_i1.p1  ORF type:complete len:239 (+),score=29.53 TRINITY_DN75868_c0_g1_i1:96-812(+)